MKAFDHIIERAAADPRHIVLAEGGDPRVAEAAARAQRENVARVTLIGETAAVEAALAEAGCNAGDVPTLDPTDSTLHERFSEAFFQLRQHKGVTRELASERMRDPLHFADMMVREGLADGCVAGAVYTTADVVRAALQILGVQPGFKLVSSFFLMLFCESHHGELQGGKIFADCGLVIEPDADELAQIALAAADSAQALLTEPTRVAMLSFATGDSAEHPRVDKVKLAAEQVRAARPDLKVSGNLQLDAAIIPDVSAKKAPDSAIEGQANVLIFPNLEAGNIGYKLAQRMGGAEAIGPIMQGLAYPANDLSRGCSAVDVFRLICVTGVQAQALHAGPPA